MSYQNQKLEFYVKYNLNFSLLYIFFKKNVYFILSSQIKLQAHKNWEPYYAEKQLHWLFSRHPGQSRNRMAFSANVKGFFIDSIFS